MIAVPEILRERFGPEATQALVELLNQLSYKTPDEIILLTEERFARRVAEAEARFEHGLTGVDRRLADLEARFERRLGDLQGHIERRLTDVIRWMVGLWIVGIGALLSVLFAFFKP